MGLTAQGGLWLPRTYTTWVSRKELALVVQLCRVCTAATSQHQLLLSMLSLRTRAIFFPTGPPAGMENDGTRVPTLALHGIPQTHAVTAQCVQSDSRAASSCPLAFPHAQMCVLASRLSFPWPAYFLSFLIIPSLFPPKLLPSNTHSIPRRGV